jgi:hypothetical protein
MPSDPIEPPFITCERHPDCLFQGGCDCKREQIRRRAIEPPSISGPNLIGVAHQHRYTIPFHGHLMCEDDYCGQVVTMFGFELTEAQREQIRAEFDRVQWLRDHMSPEGAEAMIRFLSEDDADGC